MLESSANNNWASESSSTDNSEIQSSVESSERENKFTLKHDYQYVAKSYMPKEGPVLFRKLLNSLPSPKGIFETEFTLEDRPNDFVFISDGIPKPPKYITSGKHLLFTPSELEFKKRLNSPPPNYDFITGYHNGESPAALRKRFNTVPRGVPADLLNKKERKFKKRLASVPENSDLTSVLIDGENNAAELRNLLNSPPRGKGLLAGCGRGGHTLSDLLKPTFVPVTHGILAGFGNTNHATAIQDFRKPMNLSPNGAGILASCFGTPGTSPGRLTLPNPLNSPPTGGGILASCFGAPGTSQGGLTKPLNSKPTGGGILACCFGAPGTSPGGLALQKPLNSQATGGGILASCFGAPGTPPHGLMKPVNSQPTGDGILASSSFGAPSTSPGRLTLPKPMNQEPTGGGILASCFGAPGTPPGGLTKPLNEQPKGGGILASCFEGPGTSTGGLISLKPFNPQPTGGGILASCFGAPGTLSGGMAKPFNSQPNGGGILASCFEAPGLSRQGLGKPCSPQPAGGGMLPFRSEAQGTSPCELGNNQKSQSTGGGVLASCFGVPGTSPGELKPSSDDFCFKTPAPPTGGGRLASRFGSPGTRSPHASGKNLLSLPPTEGILASCFGSRLPNMSSDVAGKMGPPPPPGRRGRISSSFKTGKARLPVVEERQSTNDDSIW